MKPDGFPEEIENIYNYPENKADLELLKLRYLKNVFPNFDENLFAGTVFDVLSSPSVAKWGTAHSGIYEFLMIRDW